MGKVIGAGSGALICTPIVGATRAALMAELDAVLTKQPDVVEWRADFFGAIAATDEVIEVARAVKERAPQTSMIFTIRSIREGGEPITLNARQSVELTAAICERTSFEYVDCELSNAPEDIVYLAQAAHRAGKKVIGSYHNFGCTPEPGFLLDKLLEAERRGLDLAKVAVMPGSLDDVLTLMRVTLEAKRQAKVPLITISMGADGAVSRMLGGVFGSSLTFGVGQSSSAPGQIPVEDLRAVLDIIDRAR